MLKMKLALCALFAALLIAPGMSEAAKKKGEGKKEAPAAAAKADAETTLKGTMVCGKCSLKEADGCQNVLKVGDAGKEVNYWLEKNDLAKANHGPVCSGSKAATVTGTVSDKDGKKHIVATAIAYE